MSISHSIGRTARWIAAARALESRREDRLFNDPWAEPLAGKDGFELLKELSPGGTANQENPYHVIRTRFIDDFLLQCLQEDAIRQVVIPAAGLDTRAFRMPWPENSHLFELDQPEVLAFKQDILDKANAMPNCKRTALGLNLLEPIDKKLVANGFDPQQPSLWIMEGLIYYLQESEARRFLNHCAELCVSGSRLVIDIVGDSFFKTAWTQPVIQKMQAINAPWLFGTDDPEGLLAESGWQAKASLPGDADANYGRWPFPPAVRDTPGVPQIFFVKGYR